MASYTTPEKVSPLSFSRQQFADYWTALISRVRQDDDCDQVFSGSMPHPMVLFQKQNHQQILDYGLTLIAEAVLAVNPIQPAELLLQEIKHAAAQANKDPPLDTNWNVFQTEWLKYKKAQRKIYAIAIATLRVGSSMHYARQVPFGAGTHLLTTIHSDNIRNTTRSLFALLTSLFTLKARPQESFDMFKMRFDLIISRFANWKPPIILPEQLLLFFALRGLPDDTFGPTKNIILATENITLTRGFQLLRDVGGSGAQLITSTLGSGDVTKPPDSESILTVTPHTPKPKPKTAEQKAADREKRKTALCKKHGPCVHHGPKSLHATSECRDPQLLKRRKKKDTQRANPQLAVVPVPPQAQAPPSAAPYPAMYPHPAPMYPPMMYMPTMPHYMAPPQQIGPPAAEQQVSHTLIITVVPNDDDPYDADSEDDYELHDHHRMQLYENNSARPPLHSLSNSGSDSDTETDIDGPPPLIAISDTTTSSDTESDDSSEGPPPLIRVSASSTESETDDSSEDTPSLVDISASSSDTEPDDDSEGPPPFAPRVTSSDDSSTGENSDSEASSGLKQSSDKEADSDSDEGPPGLISVSDSSSDSCSDVDDDVAIPSHHDNDSNYDSDCSEAPTLITCDTTSTEEYSSDSECYAHRDFLDNIPPVPIEHFNAFCMFPQIDFSYVAKSDTRFHVKNITMQVLQSLITIFNNHDKSCATVIQCSKCSCLLHSEHRTCPHCDDYNASTSNQTTPPASGEQSTIPVFMLAQHESSGSSTEDENTVSAPPSASIGHASVSSTANASSTFNDDLEFLQHAVRMTEHAEAAADPDSAEFAEYQRFAKAFAPRKPPPYVKACDRDIDRVGRGIVLDWMREQRMLHSRDEFESRISTPESSQSETLEYNPPTRSTSTPSIKPKKRFKGHGWSKKGTKATRAASRAKRKILTSPCSTPTFQSPPRCAYPGCPRVTNKKQYGMGHFLYCYQHRNTKSFTSTHGAQTTSSHAPDASPIPPTPMNVRLQSPKASVQDITDHPSASSMSREIRERALDLTSQFPRLRRARAVYAYAEGLHTVLHYPRQFLVTLRGEPAIRNDSSVSPAIIFGPQDPQDAIRATLSGVSDPEIHPRSLCNHRGCVYSQGDLITRRARHVAAIAAIDKMLQDQHRDTAKDVNLVTHSNPKDIILDTGAARHLHNNSQHFTNVRACYPQKLAGFMGKTITIAQCGKVGNFDDVLLLPTSAACVRSVGYALDRRGGSITFTRVNAFYTSPSGHKTVIARRNKIGLYSLLPNTMPPATLPVCIAVPMQVRREAVHRLHQCLGHANIENMRYVMQHSPHICGSLTTRDLALFTTCPACKMGKSTKANRPKATYSRSTIFGYRLHADTTGVIRPATSAGYKRALVVVDDASRWIFVVLLRTATSHETAAAIRQILYTVAADAHILRTQVFRSDNGTEFINSDVQSLLAQAGIRHERTCPNTSHQNGVAERAIGKLMPIVRTMIAAASALPTLWGEAIHAAAHVLNRMPCSSNQDRLPPYHIRFGRPPSVAHLQPWGITAYVRRMTHQSKVFPRADVGMLVGYGHEVSGQKGWRVRMPRANKVITSTSVSFDSNLEESVQRREASQTSTSLPQFQDPASHDPIPSVSAILPLPAAAPPVPSQTPSVASPPSALPHPVCARATGPTPLQPSQIISGQSSASTASTPPSPPTTRSMARSKSASWADVVQKADSDIEAANVPPFSRPRGRPPSNHEWDPQIGEYVPINLATATPSLEKAWVFAAMKSELVEDHETPTTYEQAIRHEHWRKAIEEELSSLKDCAVWKAVLLSTLSPTAKAIPTKWVFKIKTDGHGKVARFKARLVVCGYRQKFGRDYTLTFAPVAHAASIRMVLALAVSLRLHLRQFDIKTAFLYGELPKSQTVYLLPPKGVTVPPHHVLALQRSMYGLKQASLQWNRHLHKTLSKLKYKRTPFDPCVYHRHDEDGTYIFLAVVVDDIIAASNSSNALQSFFTQMSAVYKIKDLGEPTRLVGLNIQKLPNGLALDQNQFVKDIARDFKQLKCKPVSTPIALGEVPEGASPQLPPGHRYLSLVGSLLWASLTRPDIAVAISIACSKSINPTKADLAAAIRILRYLLHTPHIKLRLLRSSTPCPLVAVYVDAAWSNAPKSRSRYGYMVCVRGIPVLWETKITTMVCLSTAESEFVAAVHAAKSALWLVNLAATLCNVHIPTVTMFEDNQACIKMTVNPVVSSRNRHFAMRMWWLRQKVEEGKIKLTYVETQHQLADIFTKPLPKPLFIQLRDKIMSGIALVPSPAN